MPTTSACPDRRGVMFVAFGWPYLLLALQSMRSIRATNPDLSIAVTTSPDLLERLTPALRGLADEWLPVDLPASKNRSVKTSADLHSPFDRTLMIDADTFVVRELSSMFDWLDHFDIGFKLNDARLGSAGNVEKGASPVLDGHWKVDDLPHWNGAVCLFRRSEATRRFFELWNQRFDAIGSAYDQVSLVDALFLSPVRLISFDYRWNSPMKSYRNPRRGEDVVIVHYGSDIPDDIIEGARNDAGLLAPDSRPRSDLEAFLLERAEARALKDAHLASRKRARRDPANSHPAKLLDIGALRARLSGIVRRD